MIIEIIFLSLIIYYVFKTAEENIEEIMNFIAACAFSLFLVIVLSLVLSPETLTVVLVVLLSAVVVLSASVKSYALGAAYAVFTVIPLLRCWYVYGIILAVVSGLFIMYLFINPSDEQETVKELPKDFHVSCVGLVFLLPSAFIVDTESVPSWLVFALTVSLFFVSHSHKIALVAQSVLLIPIGQCWPKQALVLLLVIGALAVYQFLTKIKVKSEEIKQKKAEKAQAEREKKKRRKFFF